MRVVSWVAFLVAALAVLAPAADAQVLYWLDTNYSAPTINRANADGVALASVALPAGSLPEGLAVDATGKVYWGEAAWSNAKLNRAAPTLASITPLVSGGSVLRGVAVDNVAQLIYWTTSNLVTGAFVHRAAMSGAGAAPLIALAGMNPRGIAVDRTGGRIYWTDFEQNTIFRANLDGSGVTPWLPLGLNTGPYGIAVDSQAQRVYWTEYISGSIRSVSTGLTNFLTPVSGLVNPTYLALDVAGARMYWAEGGVGVQHIRRASLNGTNLVTLPCPLTTYGGLAFQPNGTVSLPDIAVPTEFALERPWPNPASGSTRVRFSLPSETQVHLSVYDLQGREVAVLADGVMAAGRHEQVWSARASRVAAPAGIYFVRLAAAGRAWVQRVVLTP